MRLLAALRLLLACKTPPVHHSQRRALRAIFHLLFSQGIVTIGLTPSEIQCYQASQRINMVHFNLELVWISQASPQVE